MKRILLIAAISTLAGSLVSMGQTTVFEDTFTDGSTLNPTSAVTPTSDTTAYEIASSKGATNTTIGSGLLDLATAATSSGYTEAQAQFTSSPITLTLPGQYIEIYATFVDTNNFFNGNGGNNDGVDVGLFDSGGTPLTDAANLWSSGLSGSLTNEATGDAQNWEGFSGNIQYSLTTLETSTVVSRGAQGGTTNINQGLGDESGSGGSTQIGVSSTSTSMSFPALTTGAEYTIALQITYVNSTTDTFTESLMAGSGAGGAVIESYGGNNTNGSILTDTFDSLDVGYRSVSAMTPNSATTLPLTDITVVDDLTPASVPEPSTYALLGLATLGVGLFRRRLRKPV
jgi:hypothetical protein